MSTLSTVVDAMRSGQKIQAIKAVREATSLSLKEAKDVIDAAWADRDDPSAALIVSELLHRHGKSINPGTPVDPFEAVSELLWSLSERLQEVDDQRATDVRSLAEELDEIWGCV